MLSLPLLASAKPAYPGLLSRTLPDGTAVNIRIHGDEFFNYVTDENGLLMKGGANGIVDYKLDANGAKIKATPVLLEEMRAQAYENLTPMMKESAKNGGPSRMASLNSQGRTTFPTTGDVHFLVVIIDFADRHWTLADPVTEMTKKLNGPDYNYEGALGSLRDYYIKNSNGMFTPTFDVVGVVTLPNTSQYYAGNGKYDNMKEAVVEAARMIDNEVDFSKYDYDNNGEIDNIIYFYAGYGQADTQDPSCLWPHNSSVINQGVSLDGKKLGNYCIFNELNGGQHYNDKDLQLDGLGTPIHEFGHVMGFPDLYDPLYENLATPSDWSVMDSGCYNGDGHVPPLMSGYERWVFNWVETSRINTQSGDHYEIKALSDGGAPYRHNVYTNDGTLYNNEYFLFETRKADSWDAKLPGDGMLIWHIDYDRSTWMGNRVNSTASRPRCHLITADGSANYSLGTSNGAKQAAWPGNTNYITPETDIQLFSNYLLSRGPIPHYFTSIEYDAANGVASFDYDKITSTPTATTVLNTPVRTENALGNPTNVVRFTWDPVEGATSYKLTLYRVNSSGTIFYENLLNERDLGNVTEYTNTFSANKMGIEFHAYVRPVLTIPSSRKSNEVVFIPNNLESSSVEAIAPAASVIAGGKGEIIAPADAQIFTIDGKQTGRTNLHPGIYIVRTANAAQKVIVR